jgi:hypothetical protein
LKCGVLVELAADVDTDVAEREGEQERQAPAPGVQLLGGEHAVQDRDEERGGEQAGGLAGGHQAGEQAALVVGGVFRQERGGAGVFARGGEALHQAGGEQEHSGPEPDHLVGRQQRDDEGRGRHDEDRQRQRLLPADLIAEVAPDDAADRPHDEDSAKTA